MAWKPYTLKEIFWASRKGNKVIVKNPDKTETEYSLKEFKDYFRAVPSKEL